MINYNELMQGASPLLKLGVVVGSFVLGENLRKLWEFHHGINFLNTSGKFQDVALNTINSRRDMMTISSIHIGAIGSLILAATQTNPYILLTSFVLCSCSYFACQSRLSEMKEKLQPFINSAVDFDPRENRKSFVEKLIFGPYPNAFNSFITNERKRSAGEQVGNSL